MGCSEKDVGVFGGDEEGVGIGVFVVGTLQTGVEVGERTGHFGGFSEVSVSGDESVGPEELGEPRVSGGAFAFEAGALFIHQRDDVTLGGAIDGLREPLQGFCFGAGVVAGLPSSAEVTDVVEIERDESEVEFGDIERPAPFFVGQGEEVAIGGGADIVDGVIGRVRASGGDLAIVVAEDGHEGGGCEDVGRERDHLREGFGALESFFVEAGDIVSHGEEQVRLICPNGREVLFHGVAPVTDDGGFEFAFG